MNETHIYFPKPSPVKRQPHTHTRAHINKKTKHFLLHPTGICNTQLLVFPSWIELQQIPEIFSPTERPAAEDTSSEETKHAWRTTEINHTHTLKYITIHLTDRCLCSLTSNLLCIYKGNEQQAQQDASNLRGLNFVMSDWLYRTVTNRILINTYNGKGKGGAFVLRNDGNKEKKILRNY